MLLDIGVDVGLVGGQTAVCVFEAEERELHADIHGYTVRVGQAHLPAVLY